MAKMSCLMLREEVLKMNASQRYASWLVALFKYAKEIGEIYWEVVNDDIDRLAGGKTVNVDYTWLSGVVTADAVLDILCHNNEVELVAYIIQRLKGSSNNIEEKL